MTDNAKVWWTDNDTRDAAARWLKAAEQCEAGDTGAATTTLAGDATVRSSGDYATYIALALVGAIACAVEIHRVHGPAPAGQVYGWGPVSDIQEPDADDRVAYSLAVTAANGDTRGAGAVLSAYATTDRAGIDRLFGVIASLLVLLVDLRSQGVR